MCVGVWIVEISLEAHVYSRVWSFCIWFILGCAVFFLVGAGCVCCGCVGFFFDLSSHLFLHDLLLFWLHQAYFLVCCFRIRFRVELIVLHVVLTLSAEFSCACAGLPL